jgi:DNA-directed RNA polymerase I, II, and III subunit RPABC2
MSSGIPSVPVAKAASAAAATNGSDDEDEPHNKVVGDDTDAESGGEDVLSNSNADSDNDDTSSVGATTDTDATDDEADDATGAAGAAADVDGDGDGDGDGDSADEGGDSDGDGDDIVKKNKKKSSAATAPRRKKNMEDDMTMLGVPHGLQFDDAHDDDADDDEFDEEDKDSSEYFQKLKRSVRESYVETYHPETMSHNYDEIQTLARVVRNSAGVIVDDLHRTIPIMTKYEKTRILGQRARQINEGAPAFIKIDSTVIDGYLIAVKELEQKKTPFIIRRPLPNGGSEYWRVQDLEIL